MSSDTKDILGDTKPLVQKVNNLAQLISFKLIRFKEGLERKIWWRVSKFSVTIHGPEKDKNGFIFIF